VTKTLKETFRSLQDRYYGKVIVTKTPKESLWYWTKYLILFSLVPFALTLASFTYLIPQLPRLFENNLPEGRLELKDGRLFTTAAQPIKWGNDKFAVLLNTEGKSEDLLPFETGILFTQEKYYFKSSNEDIQENTYENLKEFSVEKGQFVSFLAERRLILWLGMIAALLIAFVLAGSVFWVFRLVTFFIWGVIILLVGRFLKKEIAFKGAFNLVVYASVAPLLVFVIDSFIQHPLLSVIGFALFVFYLFYWLTSLDLKSHESIPLVPSSSEKRVVSRKGKVKRKPER